MDPQDAIKHYAHAWSQQTAEDIRAALALSWTDTCSYTDPITDTVVGVDAMTQHILGFTRQFPGATLEPTSGLDLHHHVGRFSWLMSSPTPIAAGDVDYGTEIPGVDFVEFAEDGRVQRIVGFFG